MSCKVALTFPSAPGIRTTDPTTAEARQTVNRLDRPDQHGAHGSRLPATEMLPTLRASLFEQMTRLWKVLAVIALVLVGIAIDQLVTRWIGATYATVVFLAPTPESPTTCRADVATKIRLLGRVREIADGWHVLRCGDGVQIAKDMRLLCRCP